MIGDHGMTEDGNHGGNSDEETNTVLFATHKGDKIFYKEFKDCLNLMPKLDDQTKNFIRESFFFESYLLN